MLWLCAEQSNSSLIVDDAVMLKIFRKVSAGEHPEAEMGRYLTAQGFLNTPALLGEVVRTTNMASGTRSRSRRPSSAIRAMPGAGRSTGSTARSMSLATPEGGAEERADEVADYTAIAAAIGKRLGEMHAVLARPSDDPAFAPETAARAGGGRMGEARGGAARACLRPAEETDRMGQRDGRGAGEAAACRSRSC